MTVARRWDTDSRGRGVAGAPDLAPDARRLATALEADDWIAEDAEAHLLPHIEAACAAPASRATLADWRLEADGTLAVRLVLPQPPVDRRARRAAAYDVIGAVAESRSLVLENAAGTAWDVVTGVLDGDTGFAAHGHRLRLTVDQAGPPPL